MRERLVAFLLLGIGTGAVALPHPGERAVTSGAPPAAVSTAAWGRILEGIETDRFAFQPGEPGSVVADNPEHELRFELSGSGVRVRPVDGAGWSWKLELVRFGYAGNAEAVTPAVPSAEGNRTEYHRGRLTEWYVNERRGLEQGFTVSERPSTSQRAHDFSGAPEPLVVELRTEGLQPRQDVPGESIVVVDEDEATILRYRGLLAWDAHGKHLPASMWATTTGIRIEVSDHDAAYPITIDPFIENGLLRASDAQADDSFGISAAVSGDTAIVSAWFENGGAGDPLALAGAAYIFQRDQGGPGNWGEVKKLVPSDTHADQWFGTSVAIEGDTAVVGAFHGDDGPGGTLDKAGSAYVFGRDQGGADNWGEVKRLTASDRQPADNFGVSVAISGDTIAVGSYSEEGGAGNPRPRAGAAYVFERNEGGADNWGETKKLVSSDTQKDDRFGISVAVSGDTLVVGAFFEAGPFAPLSNTGAAYVFDRNNGGPGNWGEVKKLTASDTQQYDRFGVDVALSGDTAIIGSYLESGGPGNPLFQSGAAYIYERDHGGAHNWGEVRKLTASDAQIDDQFGISVSISGDTAVVGAHMEGGGFGNPLPGAGAVYVYERNHGGVGRWGESGKIMSSEAQGGDGFGEVVGLSNGALVVGARFEDGGPGDPIADTGAAYVFDRTHWAYVMDVFGGIHGIGTGVTTISPAPPYFGFDVARDLELTSGGGHVLDGFGGVHAAGSLAQLNPGPPYFGFDISQDLELAAEGGGYALDGFGGIHALGGAPVLSPQPPYFGFDVARDMELAGAGLHVLDGFGGLHSGGGIAAISPGLPYFGFDIARDFELTTADSGYALDGFGGVHALGSAAVLNPAAPYFGFDVARDLELEPGGPGYYVLDGFGGFHTGGGATPLSPAPPYFGFEAARDVEIR